MINQNTNITKEIKAALGLSELTGYPRKVADAIIPVVEVNKKFCDVVESGTNGATIYTTPTTRDFYLCSAFVSYYSGDGTENVYITAVINGVTKNIIYGRAHATAATGETIAGFSINPCYPIKIDRGTAIIVVGTAGYAGISGYTEEVTGD